MSRRRRLHPTSVREWVLELDEEEIHAELLRRQRILASAIAPYRLNHERFASAVVAAWGQHFGWPSSAISSEFVHLVADTSARLAIATYWQVRPYRDGYSLPRVQLYGYPWDVGPGRVHFLDLPPHAVRAAVSRIPVLRARRRSTPAPPPPDEETCAERAAGELRRTGPDACKTPLVMATIARTWSEARHASALLPRRAAAKRLARLFQAIVASLAREASIEARDPRRLLEQYEQLVAKTRAIATVAKGGAVPDELLARARRSLGPAFSAADLAALVKAPRTFARQALTEDGGDAGRVVRLDEALRYARKAAAIDEEWAAFRVYCLRLSAVEQARLFPPLPVPPWDEQQRAGGQDPDSLHSTQ